MDKSKEINNFIVDMSDDPSPIERLESRFDELVKLIKSSKGSIKEILNDRELTKLVIDVSNGKDTGELLNYLKDAFSAMRKSFSEMINFSECSFGLVVNELPKSDIDIPGTVLFDSDVRKIVVVKNFGYIIDFIPQKCSVSKFSTTGNSTDMNNWKFVGKQLMTRESLANIIK